MQPSSSAPAGSGDAGAQDDRSAGAQARGGVLCRCVGGLETHVERPAGGVDVGFSRRHRGDSGGPRIHGRATRGHRRRATPGVGRTGGVHPQRARRPRPCPSADHRTRAAALALFAERRLAALPADHPLAQRTSVSTADSQWSTRSLRANAKRTQTEKRPQFPIRVNPPRCSAWTVSGTPAPACTRSVSTTASLGVPKT